MVKKFLSDCYNYHTDKYVCNTIKIIKKNARDRKEIPFYKKIEFWNKFSLTYPVIDRKFVSKNVSSPIYILITDRNKW